MANTVKKRDKVPATTPKRKQRMVCLMSGAHCGCLSKEIQDKQQGALASRDGIDFHSPEDGRGLSYLIQ